ncbi:hypothetical protein [Spiroplasma endosymbiont of Virgichneumon dumeticola]|uniref:hypothetical protein n=1 Tax=Spiroplasma endosymbiont of Virgichneumon dumeticola TaxID=3139323 RepID=UPI0035C9167B
MAREFSKLLVNYKIKWFDVATGGHDISNQSQIAGHVWVKISTSSTDNNWTGSTDRI